MNTLSRVVLTGHGIASTRPRPQPSRTARMSGHAGLQFPEANTALRGDAFHPRDPVSQFPGQQPSRVSDVVVDASSQ